MRNSLFLAFACCAICLCSSLAADQVIKCPSPDGRFALRITRGDDGAAAAAADIIEKKSGAVVMDRLESFAASDIDPANRHIANANLVWSADSRRVAYVYDTNRGADTQVFVLNGEKFEQVLLPDFFKHLKLRKLGSKDDYEKVYETLTPVRWLKSGALVLSDSVARVTTNDEDDATFIITIAFDAQNHASVKKVRKTKTKVEE
jgi:hypothetical protein